MSSQYLPQPQYHSRPQHFQYALSAQMQQPLGNRVETYQQPAQHLTHQPVPPTHARVEQARAEYENHAFRQQQPNGQTYFPREKGKLKMMPNQKIMLQHQKQQLVTTPREVHAASSRNNPLLPSPQAYGHLPQPQQHAGQNVQMLRSRSLQLEAKDLPQFAAGANPSRFKRDTEDVEAGNLEEQQHFGQQQPQPQAYRWQMPPGQSDHFSSSNDVDANSRLRC